jgi:hypothetical protein
MMIGVFVVAFFLSLFVVEIDGKKFLVIGHRGSPGNRYQCAFADCATSLMHNFVLIVV